MSKSLDGVIESWNSAAVALFGYTAVEALGQPVAMLVPLDRRDELVAIMAQIRRGHRVAPLETVRVTKDGRRLDVALRISLVHDAGGKLIGASSIARDISERVRMETALRAAERRFHAVFELAPIGVCLVSLAPDAPARLLQVNPALAQILGGSPEQLTGTLLSSLACSEDPTDIDAEFRALIEGRSDRVEFEKRLMHRSGLPVWTLISASLLTEADGEQPLAITHIIDIADRKRSEVQLQYLADHDALTGLFNRRRFTGELGRALRHGRRHRDAGAVLFLDLDGFKFINDTLGHAAGDRLIVGVAGALSGALRETDTLARIGGDEFAVLLTRCDQTAAVAVAEKLLATLRRGAPRGPDDCWSRVSSSIGIALFGADDLLSPDELVVEADIAMYEAKNAGKDRCAVYDRSAGPRGVMSTREGWDGRLRRAIDEDGFVLHAQPIAPICASGAPAFELLIRLPDERGGLIAPGAFLYNAEEFGLIEQIGRWVLGQAVGRLHDSHAAGQDLTLAINVTGTTMSDPKYGSHVAELLSGHRIPRDRLIFEVTETVAIKNIDCARSLGNQLRALGCPLAIDDFGAGFASFYFLKLLHFDFLKIDGKYIRELCATPTDQLVVEAIVTLARGLGTRTIAEFDGDNATVSLLRALGVDYAQGYHLGRPRPLEEVLPYLMTPRSTRVAEFAQPPRVSVEGRRPRGNLTGQRRRANLAERLLRGPDPPHPESARRPTKDGRPPAERTDSTEIDLESAPDRRALDAISVRLGEILDEQYGRRPARIDTYAVEDIILVVMRNGAVTPLERTLIESGRPERIGEIRRDFERMIIGRYREAVEALTGRSVLTALSQAHFEPDLTVEIFFIGEPLPGRGGGALVRPT